MVIGVVLTATTVPPRKSRPVWPAPPPGNGPPPAPGAEDDGEPLAGVAAGDGEDRPLATASAPPTPAASATTATAARTSGRRCCRRDPPSCPPLLPSPPAAPCAASGQDGPVWSSPASSPGQSSSGESPGQSSSGRLASSGSIEPEDSGDIGSLLVVIVDIGWAVRVTRPAKPSPELIRLAWAQRVPGCLCIWPGPSEPRVPRPRLRRGYSAGPGGPPDPRRARPS